jgi:hypothetical protein
MYTLREPVGPQDRKVYLRRRLVALACLVAVIAVVVLVLVKPGASGGAKEAAQVEVPNDIAGSSAAAAKKKAAGEEPACAAGQLKVLPITNKTGYAAGQLPELALSVENVGNDACTADLGSAGMKFEVMSGDDQVWRSTDCQKNPESLAVILDPGEPLESKAIVWDRTRSSPETCDISRDPVLADGASYHLNVTAAGVNGAQTVQFLLD